MLKIEVTTHLSGVQQRIDRYIGSHVFIRGSGSDSAFTIDIFGYNESVIKVSGDCPHYIADVQEVKVPLGGFVKIGEMK